MQTNFLIDTGSNITIVMSEVYQMIPESVRPDLKIVSTMLLANGRSLPFTGKADMGLQLGRTEVVHEVWVANIGLDGILGMDFMCRLGCELTYDQGHYQLILPEGSVVCAHHQLGTACCHVAVSETVVIPPGTEMIVPGKYMQPSRAAGPGVLEVAEQFVERKHLLVAKTQVDMGRKEIPLRLLNLTSTHQTVHKDTTVAWCEPI